MSGKSQEEATSILRSLNAGCTVNLVVSRSMIVDHLDQTDDQRTNEFCDATEQLAAVGKGEAEDIKATDGGLIKVTTVPEKGQIGEVDTKGEGQVKDTLAGDRGQMEKNISKTEDLRQGDTAVTDKGQAYITNKGQAPATDNGQVPVTDKGQVPVTDKGQAPATDKGQIGEDRDTSPKDMDPERLTITIARTEHQGNGLGISVKGKTLETATETKDLGLFIWSILPGGAAAKDGRLKPDDRLMGINGKSLIDSTNNDAMTILRGVLQCNTCRSIELTVLRNRLTPDMFMKDIRFRVPVTNNYLSCVQSRGQIVSNFSDTISACEKVGSQQVVCSAAESNVSRLIERKEAIPVESYVWLPSVTENPVAELRSLENSLAADICDHDDSVAKEAVASSEQEASANNCLQMDSYLCGSSRAVKDSESSSTSELDSELGPLGVFSRDGFGRQSVSEKRKACVDPRSFALYHQIKNGKRENVPNPVKRALSVESISILSQKMINSTVSPISRVSDENLKRFNSFESMQTVAQSCLQRTVDASQNRSPQDVKQLSFRDAFGYCYESQLITGENIDGESSRLGQSALAGDRKKKKKVLRGLSSVFRFGKTKKNPIDNNVRYCQTEGERKLSEKRQRLQSNVIPNTSITERLLQTARFPSGGTNDISIYQEHSETDTRREHCHVLDRSAQSNSALLDRPTGICQCQINSRQVQCHHCLTGINEHEKMEDSSLREFQIIDRYSIQYSNQNPPQAQCLPNRQSEQCSNCSESTSGRTQPMFISANKTRFRELPGRQRRQKVGGKLVSHNAPDPGSRRFPCCHASGEEICFPEGYYHKLESMESVNRWNTPEHLPAENSSVSKCDTPATLAALRTDQNVERNIPKDLSCGKHRLTVPNTVQI